MLEAERAEWIAIISECIESGTLACLPPPFMFSNGVNVLAVSSSGTFNSRFNLCFFFRSATAGASTERAERRPVFKAPPLKPERQSL